MSVGSLRPVWRGWGAGVGLASSTTLQPEHLSRGAGWSRPRQEMLDHVGLVVWQSAFVLAELLLRAPPLWPVG